MDNAINAIQNTTDPTQAQSYFVGALYNALGPGGENILGCTQFNQPDNNIHAQPGDIYVPTPFTLNGTSPSGEAEMRLHFPLYSQNVDLSQILPDLPIQFASGNGHLALSADLSVEVAILVTNGSLSLAPVHLNVNGAQPPDNPTPTQAQSQMMFSIAPRSPTVPA